ncbi:MAG: protein jag, partial [SAR202 cluster bacterium]|nr:protein jag [SAR202 cluster bacterium]
MEQPIEVSGRTVEEAIELALRQLGARRDEVEVDVLSQGKPGFLGFGAELARVRLIRSSALEADDADEPKPRPRSAPPQPTPPPPTPRQH